VTQPEIESHEPRIENLCVEVEQLRFQAQTVTQTEIECQEEGLENLRLEVESLKNSVDGQLDELRSGLEKLRTPKPSPGPSPLPLQFLLILQNRRTKLRFR
jgi:FtsZ-binding cell division protein ZapB